MVEDLPEIDIAADPADNAILATAIAARADLLVTGDRSHLLALKSADGIPIVSPREALRRIAAS